MNFYVSKRPARKRINKTAVIIVAAFLLLILAIFANRIRESLRKPENSYDIHHKTFGMMNYTESTLATSFAENLCVVDDGTSSKRVNMKKANAACLFSLNQKEVLYSKNAHKRVYPASLTKIMTALVVLENVQLDEKVKVSVEIDKLPKGSSACNIRVGDELTVEQLLYGMLLPSGGDAALALASYVAGDSDSFCKMMNDKAFALGATNTNFVNPHGFFEKKHYTTAYDMYLIFNAAIKNPDFVRIIGTPQYICNYVAKSGKAAQLTFTNTNLYVNGSRKSPKEAIVIGGKTGYTSEAGRCLTLLCKDIDNNPYIAAIFKADDQVALYSQMDNLLKEIE